MKLVAGNWKMNGDRRGAQHLVESLIARRNAGAPACTVALCPPAQLLGLVGDLIAGQGLELGAQDCSDEAGPGAFTGEISAAMLADLRCRFVILGHSERRQRHQETDDLVARKTERALAAGLTPIVCVGESLAEREAGKAQEVVGRQIQGSLPPSAKGKPLVVAYEPIWAIGTGKTATPSDVEAMHGALRKMLIGLGFGANVRLLYGGSVKPANAKELMAVANVDGALVGGASLKAEEFWPIVQACA